MTKLAVIIPAYNEEESIASVVEALVALKIEGLTLTPVVVNDNSKDRTADIVRKLNCVLLELPVNLGIGGAVQTGFRYAFDKGFDYAIQVDGDGQHPAREIEKLYDAMISSDANIVIGSRFLTNEGFQSSGLRRFGINYLKNLIRLFSGISILDNTSGFRMLDRQALALVSESYPDEYPEPESIIMYIKNGFKIKEVPVIMEERQGGVSSIRYFDQLYYMIKVSLAIIYTYIRNK